MFTNFRDKTFRHTDLHTASPEANPRKWNKQKVLSIQLHKTDIKDKNRNYYMKNVS
jgi:hypothetical protein